MTLYTDLQAVASSMMADFGQTVVLTNVATGTHNPVTGAITGQTETNQSVNAVVFDYTTKEAGQQYDGEMQIRRSDKKVLISAADLTAAPTLKSTVTWLGNEWRVINIKETAPSGVGVLYELQVRR